MKIRRKSAQRAAYRSLMVAAALLVLSCGDGGKTSNDCAVDADCSSGTCADGACTTDVLDAGTTDTGGATDGGANNGANNGVDGSQPVEDTGSNEPDAESTPDLGTDTGGTEADAGGDIGPGEDQRLPLPDYFVCSDDGDCPTRLGECVKSIPLNRADGAVNEVAVSDLSDKVQSGEGICTEVCTSGPDACAGLSLPDADGVPVPFTCQVVFAGSSPYPDASAGFPVVVDEAEMALGQPFGAVCRPPFDVSTSFSESFCQPCDGNDACADSLCWDFLAADVATDAGVCLDACADDSECPVGFACDSMRTATQFLGTFCAPVLDTCGGCKDTDGDGRGTGLCGANNLASAHDCDDLNADAYFDSSDPLHAFPQHCGAHDYNCNGVSDDTEQVGSDAFPAEHCTACGDTCAGPGPAGQGVDEYRCLPDGAGAPECIVVCFDDADCDGVLSADDCDDNDENSTIVANDADCDGVLTADDCDDADAMSTTVAQDADCDGTLTADDCDDLDPMSTAIADDADCDGTVTADDCDDNDSMSYTRAQDADCDGALTADDCDDTNPFSTLKVEDADCDGTLTADDCDDNDALSTIVATDADCDAVLTADDCNDAVAEGMPDPALNNRLSTRVADDADCDGTLTASDCNDADPRIGGEDRGVFISPSGASNGAGTLTAPIGTETAFATAISTAQSDGKDVYVFSGNHTSNTTITVADGVSIYGGFSYSAGVCSRSATKSSVTVTSDARTVIQGFQVILLVGMAADSIASPTTISQMSVRTENAQPYCANCVGGLYPIHNFGLRARWADELILDKSSFTAGAGLGGLDGTDGALRGERAGQYCPYWSCDGNGADGGDGTGSTTMLGTQGGGRSTQCGAWPSNTLQYSGTGSNDSPGAGTAGEPGKTGNANGGNGGASRTASGSTCYGVSGSNGARGSNGASASVPATTGYSVGSLLIFGGVGANGTTGGDGGAGGGGGACRLTNGSAAGGGGGTGGCSGSFGTGGRAGGASVGGMIIFSGEIVQVDTSFSAGDGGDGGNGGDGGPGGTGGAGGAGALLTPGGNTYQGGKGGNGGDGGNGGSGGGGAGGDSVGLWLDRSSFADESGLVTISGNAGAGGAGGMGAVAGSDGSATTRR